MFAHMFKQKARIVGKLAIVTLVTLAAVGTADAQQRPPSQVDSRDSEARGTTRQTTSPGQAPSSRREPSRLREDNATPTVQNRAPEVLLQRPETLPAPLPTPLPQQRLETLPTPLPVPASVTGNP